MIHALHSLGWAIVAYLSTLFLLGYLTSWSRDREITEGVSLVAFAIGIIVFCLTL
jgi:hypothetical protein